jgi:hypothetical protein
VIADVRLPRGSARAILRRLASCFRPVPLVLMSGSPLPAELDGLPFLRKPFDLDALLTIVAASLPDPVPFHLTDPRPDGQVLTATSQ